MMKKLLLIGFLIFIPKLSFAACDAQTVLMLHMNGTDASTTFTDSSTSAHTVTANGNAQIDTAQKKFGTASGLFDGTGDFLTVDDTADWDFGTGDFTVDFWVRFSTVGNTHIYEMGNASGAGGAGDATGVSIRFSSSGGRWELYFQGSEVSDTSISQSPSADTWYHIALVRDGTDVKFFIDGTQTGNTFTNSSNITMTATFSIGQRANGTEFFNGWLDELRVSKGVARWTSNFTPETSEYCAATASTHRFLQVL